MLLVAKELVLSVSIHDCTVQHFRSGGKGGQNQNKRDTGTRVIHVPSGARGESREERSQLQNTRIAFTRMTQTGAFKSWVNRQLLGEPAEKRVEREMRSENLIVWGRKDERWVVID